MIITLTKRSQSEFIQRYIVNTLQWYILSWDTPCIGDIGYFVTLLKKTDLSDNCSASMRPRAASGPPLAATGLGPVAAVGQSAVHCRMLPW